MTIKNSRSQQPTLSDLQTVQKRKNSEKNNLGFLLSSKRYEEIDFYGFSGLNKPQTNSSINHADFITLVIPFICLFSLLMLICGVTVLRSSSIIPAISPRPALYTPNIRITEPSSVVEFRKESNHNSGGRGYLSPNSL